MKSEKFKKTFKTITDTGIEIKITVFANEPRVFLESEKFKGWGTWGKLPNTEGIKILNGKDFVSFAMLSQKVKHQIEDIKIELAQKQYEAENRKIALIDNCMVDLVQADQEGKSFEYPKYLKIPKTDISDIKDFPFIQEIRKRAYILARLEGDIEKIFILSAKEKEEIVRLLKK